MECIFCQIIKKEQPADIIYEDNDFIVFKDIKPSAPIHLLLVPKIHIPSVNNLEEEHINLIGKLFLLAKKIAKNQKTENGYKLIFNVGRKGGQIINHLHLHLMGGWSDPEN